MKMFDLGAVAGVENPIYNAAGYAKQFKKEQTRTRLEHPWTEIVAINGVNAVRDQVDPYSNSDPDSVVVDGSSDNS